MRKLEGTFELIHIPRTAVNEHPYNVKFTMNGAELIVPIRTTLNDVVALLALNATASDAAKSLQDAAELGKAMKRLAESAQNLVKEAAGGSND